MVFLNFLKRLWNKPVAPFTGALFEEPLGAIQFNEIVGQAAPVLWKERPPRTFPELNQKKSFMCAAFSGAKYLGITYQKVHGNYLDFSPVDIYKRRKNKPAAGMYLGDIFNIFKEGVTLDSLVNCPIETDEDAEKCTIQNYKRDVGAVFRISGEPIYLPAGDIEAAASVIQHTGKGIILFTYFKQDEWGRAVPLVQADSHFQDPDVLRHLVVATDYVLLNGVKCLVVEDSAHFGGISRRMLTKGFYEARVPYAAYTMNFVFSENKGVKPFYDGSIASLQDCLKWEGVFPLNTASTGLFLTLTKKGVNDFQRKYGIQQTGAVGPVTSRKLKELFPL